MSNETSKFELLKRLRAAGLAFPAFVAIFLGYSHWIPLPEFESLEKFTGNVLHIEHINNQKKNCYSLSVMRSSKSDRYTTCLGKNEITSGLTKKLLVGDQVTIWMHKNFDFSINFYQIEKNGLKVVSYKDIVNLRKGNVNFETQDFIFFALCILTSLISHLILKYKKAFKGS
ncbi:hypothetical protein GCM10007916_31970 [Psychromonas marina]|uniref:DUF3592 domain-containing protein n=1 Tax=Psychromonas marina TaxID=88364 RepID=A0ABQ6E436_9GAMM|nr:hypothetical protein [Psychromonas marina]GLS92127.1 hypothetical protein GCM10007916_31970 [Psychromonas marina]